jgi:hypothetical protein
MLKILLIFKPLRKSSWQFSKIFYWEFLMENDQNQELEIFETVDLKRLINLLRWNIDFLHGLSLRTSRSMALHPFTL